MTVFDVDLNRETKEYEFINNHSPMNCFDVDLNRETKGI